MAAVDGRRSAKTQMDLFICYRDSLVEKQYPGTKFTRLTSDQQEAINLEAQDMVSLPPSKEDLRKFVPHHFTGAAVDVVLIDITKYTAEGGLEGAMVDMGSVFDAMLGDLGGLPSHLTYLETDPCPNIEARDNRRLLNGLLSMVGLSGYGPEWFHRQAGNQLGDLIENKEVAKSAAQYGMVPNWAANAVIAREWIKLRATQARSLLGF